MNISKKTEKTFSGDAYFLETLNDKAIVNNNYEGFMVLNKDIEIIKMIDIDQEVCIYNAIVIDDARILFNCIDDKELIVVNIETADVKSYDMPQVLVEEVIRDKVALEGDFIILKTYKDHTYVLDLNHMDIKRCDQSIGDVIRNDSEKAPRDCIGLAKVGNEKAFLFEKELRIIDEDELIIIPDKDYYFIKIKAVDCGSQKGLFVLESSFDGEMYKILYYTF